VPAIRRSIIFQVNFEVGAELNDRYLKSTAMSCLDNKRVRGAPTLLTSLAERWCSHQGRSGCREGAINIAACVDDDDTGWWQATLPYQGGHMHVVLDGEIFATCQQNILIRSVLFSAKLQGVPTSGWSSCRNQRTWYGSGSSNSSKARCERSSAWGRCRVVASDVSILSACRQHHRDWGLAKGRKSHLCRWRQGVQNRIGQFRLCLE
jgi:hypothetical protein